MFGYITANNGELNKEALARYRAMYCGVCASLRRQYGSIDRMVLSNDMTFLALLLHSLYEPAEVKDTLRCPVHPLKPHDYIASSMLDYAADMNLILAWYKIQDDIADEGSLKARAAKELLQQSFDQVSEKYPEKCAVIRECLDRTSALEKQGSRDIDALCRWSGRMLAEVFAFRRDVWEEKLRRIGYGLGCFIYLMDAYEDYDEDLRKGCFNPLTELHRDEHYDETIRDDLMLLVADAVEAFEALPLEKDIEILRNILYHGLWSKWVTMHQKRKEAGEHGE